MLVPLPNTRLIPYGTTRWSREGLVIAKLGPRLVLSSDFPCAVIDRNNAEPLRLNTSRYEPSLAPDLTLGGSDQFDFIRDYLKRLCGPWDGLSQRFLNWYFAAVTDQVRRNEAMLTERLGATRGLYRVSDWAFSAPKPLPRAHLFAPVLEPDAAAGDNADYIEVPFAFWLGDKLMAVRPREAALTPRKAASETARLQAAGIELTAFSAAELGDVSSPLFARILAPPRDAFWQGQALPMGPFRPTGLDD